MPRDVRPRTPPPDDDTPTSDESEEAVYAAKVPDEDEDENDVPDPTPARSPAVPAKKKKEGKGDGAIAVYGGPRLPRPSTLILPSDGIVTASFRDERKLAKKHTTDLARWKGKHRAAKLTAYVNQLRDEARKQFGHSSMFVGEESEGLIIGIPTPSLAFEYVIAQNIYPLGVIMQLVAKTGVGKSALLAEFGRWFDMAGGLFSLMENETKFNPIWYKSILGPRAYKRLPIARCTSVEDWQRKMTFGIKNAKTMFTGTKEAPGPGRTIPVLLGVDSIMGKQSENTTAKVFGEKTKAGGRGKTGDGAASRGFPEEALIITRYLRSLPSELDNWPFAVCLVNHLRINKNDKGMEERSKSGGAQVDFQESFELELTRTKAHIECAAWEGFQVMLSCHKNSFGPGHRRVATRVIWWDEEDPRTGEWVQRTVWDWDWSTVWLLNHVLNGERSSPRMKKSLKDAGVHVSCPSESDVENTAWSANLGMKKKNAVPWAVLGAMIREDAELTSVIRRALRINERHVLTGDYLAQIEEAAGSVR